MADESTPTTERKALDWERIGVEYRAGKLSLREIGRQHGCSEGAIRKRAKADKWTRDLSARVDEAVRNKLVRAQVRAEAFASVPAATEAEVVDSAAEASVAVILAHRKDLAKLREIEEKLIAQLGGDGADEPTKLYLSQYQGQIIEKEVSLTVSEKASTLLALATARGRRIDLERKAFNLDAVEESKTGNVADTIADILQEVIRGKAGKIPLPAEEERGNA